MVEAKKIDKDLDWLKQVSREVDLSKEDISDDLKVLEEFCLNNNYCIASVIFSNYFSYSDCTLYILGSDSFYNELCEDFNNNVNIIKL